MDWSAFGWWPGGAWGAFLLFLFPVGPGTTAGILVARSGGVEPLAIAALYVASDLLTALYMEPLLRVVARVGSRYAWARDLGRQMMEMVARIQLAPGRWGQFGSLIVLGMGGMILGALAIPGMRISRALGWLGVIVGDCLHFAFLLATALGLATILPDDRLVFVAVLAIAMLAGRLTRRLSATIEGPRPAERALAAERLP